MLTRLVCISFLTVVTFSLNTASDRENTTTADSTP